MCRSPRRTAEPLATILSSGHEAAGFAQRGNFTMTFFQKLLSTNAPAAVILIRLIVGGVFLSEAIQKFLMPEAQGVGRFTKIGIPNPDLLAPFVGICEIVCGVLFILGFLTRFAAVTMIINMLVAIL